MSRKRVLSVIMLSSTSPLVRDRTARSCEVKASQSPQLSGYTGVVELACKRKLCVPLPQRARLYLKQAYLLMPR